jgi:ubiquinone biosynthesis protein COQ4
MLAVGIQRLAWELAEHGSTLGEASAVLSTNEHQLLSDALLLEDAGFRQLHAERWDPAPPELATLAALPEGSLGHAYAGYMAHYRLAPGFFPIPVTLEPGVSPTRYAVHRLNRCHDLLHVLGAYETSDADEAAIQSFAFGHVPVVLAVFLAEAAAHAAIGLDHYKHLRDIFVERVRAEDFRRGAAAGPLLGVRLEACWEAPLEPLQRELGIAPRTAHAQWATNSCRGVTERSFFSRAA